MSKASNEFMHLIENSSSDVLQDLIPKLNYANKLDLVMSEIYDGKYEKKGIINIVMDSLNSRDEKRKGERLEAAAIMSAIAEIELAPKRDGGMDQEWFQMEINDNISHIVNYNLINDKVDQAILVANAYPNNENIKDIACWYLDGTINDKIANNYLSSEKDVSSNCAQFVGRAMGSKQIMGLYEWVYANVHKDEAAKTRVEVAMMYTKDLGLDTGNFYAIEMADKKAVLFKDRFSEIEQKLLDEVAPKGKLKVAINNFSKVKVNDKEIELSLGEKIVRLLEKALTRIKNIGKSKAHQKENRVVLKSSLRERSRTAKAINMVKKKSQVQQLSK